MIEDKKPWSFCETPEEKCTMNYCDDNGCLNRKRNLVEKESCECGKEITVDPGARMDENGCWACSECLKELIEDYNKVRSDMKALSIKQPWASLIAHGIKDIENRTWKTHFRGRVYIHVSALIFDGKGHPLTPDQLKIIQSNHKNNGFPLLSDLPYSAVIGEVDIVDCVLNHPSIWADKSDSIKGKTTFNWVLDNAKLYEEPIMNVKGNLSFWKFN